MLRIANRRKMMHRLLLCVLAAILAGCTHSKSADQNDTPVQKPTVPGSTLQCTQSVMNGMIKADRGHERVRYSDFNGHERLRHILTEKEYNGRTLVLIIEDGLTKQDLPQIMYRHSFAPAESKQLAKLLNIAHYPRANTPEIRADTAHSLTTTNNPLWPIDHQWTQADEDDYSKWINTNAGPNLLAGGGVNVDCADFAMTMRWIYSHDHHLPAGQTLAGNGQLFGSWQSTTDWDKLPTDADWHKDQRFKAALKYVLNATYTHSLFLDLYPVTITPAYVDPSTIYLTLRAEDNSGHTQTIYNIGTGGACDQGEDCISVIWGNEPASELGYISGLVPTRLDQGAGGFLRYRWPEKDATGNWALRAAAQMPGYSLEQYGWNDTEYLSEISSRLGLWANADERYTVEADALASSIQGRLQVTERGYFMCSLVPCTLNDDNWQMYSTPGHDSRLKSAIQSFKADGANVDPNGSTIYDLQEKYGVSPLFAGATFTAWDVMQGTVAADKFNSDPTTDFFARWGITAPAADVRLQALAQIFFDNWQWRETLVNQAQSLCYPNNDAKPVCNACDPKVVALDTTRLDQAFRLAQQNFTALYNQASSNTQQSIAQILSQEMTSEFCDAAQTQACTMYDYVIGDPTRWQKMSSDPTAPLANRY